MRRNAIKTSDIVITQSLQVFITGEYVGFIDDDIVYVVGSSGHAVKLGAIDHRSEAVSLIVDWFNGSSSSPA